ncbi:zinc-binding dehydrogenase [Paenalkalicoccus suaedae]|uniref:Zinc-binding dehydrogenase n=1 Tax=Paenalkalicoccus suaedae TaxID=2592382 RepID=A0A859FFM9_9BACI|nr:zinc-binding dehydrogenase [Paenalkalicoccus suaedae]QKS71628.1 zinc-binding dehydrogenase [Paenalkalicoccus suaedae]
MRALLLEEKGKWTDMTVQEIEKPKPQAGQLLVRVKAAGLNPVDYKTGTNGYPGWEYPHVLGLDVAGVVEEIGEGVTEFKEQDHVVFLNDMSKKGGFAEYAIAEAHTATKLPYNVLFTDAAALPVAAYTAYQALFDKIRVRAGESILIHAGAGGVGGFAIQLAKQAGLYVFTTAQEHNHEHVLELGADVAIDYKKESFVDRIMEETNGVGVDAILDTVSRDNANESVKALAFNGHLAFIAGQPKMDDSIEFGHPKSFHHVALGSVYQSTNLREQKRLQEIGNDLVKRISNGMLNTIVTEKIVLSDVPRALEKLQSRSVRGKIVVEL